MSKQFLLPLYSPILFLLILSVSDLHSQTTFAERIGSANSDFGISCQPTSDNGIILVQEGSTNGMDLHLVLTKTDLDGVVEWSKLYQIGDWCLPSSVLQAKDGGYIVLGSSSDSTFVNNNKHVLFLYKTDVSGDGQWNKQFSFSNNDMPLNLVNRESGGYIAFSVADYNLGGYPRSVVSEIDLSGNVVWSKQFGAAYGLTAVKGVELPNRNICFVSMSADVNNSFFNDVVVTLLDSSGNFLWSKKFGTHYDDEPNAVTSNANNEILVTGRSYFMNREWDSFFLKLDANGNKLNSNFLDAGTYNGEIMRCIQSRSDGSVVLLGDIGTFDERDITLINLDSNGVLSSAKKYPFSPNFTNYPYEMFISPDQGIVFTGDFRPPNAYRDAILVKTENNGDLSCISTNVSFTEYNDSFSDTNFALTTSNSTLLLFSFHDSIPFNVIQSHVVCALATNVDEQPEGGKIIGSIYPNPTYDELIINPGNIFGIERIILYDMAGKKILERPIGQRTDEIKLNLAGITSGVYLLECLSGDAIERIRIEKL